jgi:hypothetical protein
MRIRHLAVFGLALLLCAPAMRAQADGQTAPLDEYGGRRQPPRSPMDQLDRLMRMPPEQREQVLSRLPPQRRQNLEKRLERYSRLSPEQRELVRAQYNWFHNMPPEKQFELRKAFGRFVNQPPERQDAMRDELEQLRAMRPPQRWQTMGSPDFRNRFNPNERDIIGRIADLMP